MVLRHTAFNLIGLGIPLLTAVFSIPPLIAALGLDRFGLLTLLWAIVSYFGVFDLGLGRALTQQLAIAFANHEYSRVGPLIGTAIFLMGLLGVVAAGLIATAAPWIVSLFEAVPDTTELAMAVYAMAAAMPAILLTPGFRGVLEARRAFGIVNLIRVPTGLFTFLGPLAVVVYFEPRLDWIAWVLAAGRVASCGVHAYCAWRLTPSDARMLVRWEFVRPLCVFGGWMTVSNVISPLMGYADRFIVGAVVSASAVAYYATPHEVVTKLWIIPGALTATLLPTFAAQIARRDSNALSLFQSAVRWLFVALLPMTLALALFAYDLLTLWVGEEFAKNSESLLQIFAVGILINCLAHIPFTFLQSAGAPRLIAIVHLVELPFFLGGLWWLTSMYGVVGAAFAWLLRMAVDSAVLFGLGYRLLGRSPAGWLSVKTIAIAMLAAIGFSGSLSHSVTAQELWIAAAALAAIGVCLWWPQWRKVSKAKAPSGALNEPRRNVHEQVPLVSIVTPAYNQAPYVRETIESVLAQNYGNLQYIVIDDGSSDETPEILGEYKDRIRVHRHANIGQARTLNKGWEMAEGKYLGYLSSDDILHPDMVRRLVDVLENDSSIVCVFPDCNLVDDQSRIIKSNVCRPFDLAEVVIKQECYIGVGALFRASAFRSVGGWKPELRLAPDRDFWIRLARHGRIHFYPQILASYRMHARSISYKEVSEDVAREYVNVLDSYFGEGSVAPEILVRKREAYAYAHLLLARNSFRAGKFQRGLQLYREACELHPGLGNVAVKARIFRNVVSKPLRVAFSTARSFLRA